MKKKLDAYRSRLTPGQIADGMNAAARNARRLSEDAESLVSIGRFPTAASVAALSIEEAGKVSILRELALARTDADALEVWKRYRSHTSKNIAWLLPQLAAAGARRLDDLRPLFDETSDHPFVLDNLKQLGFYTDCLGNAHWALPWEVIDEGLARMLVQIAKALAGKDQHTAREIALWMEHIGPVWKKDPAWMKQALVNWYGAMQAEGLATDGPNAMEQFIRYGVQEKGV
ncbi:AbiV family abortive infection protein [Candidatus Manganitrophus noduliformans]|nr:AbiV family abortive infection protein [Candidatus Manganitrophus noduliformans]